MNYRELSMVVVIQIVNVKDSLTNNYMNLNYKYIPIQSYNVVATVVVRLRCSH